MILPMLAVKDYDASVKFYVEKLGFASDFTMKGPDGSNIFGFVSKGKNVQIGLSLDPALAQRGDGVVLMLYPDAFDIDAYYAEVKAKGIAIIEDLKTEYWGDRVFSVRDIDGYYLTFATTVEQKSVDEIQSHMAQPRG